MLKDSLYRSLEGIVPMPRTAFPSDEGDLATAAEVGLPAVVKPLLRCLPQSAPAGQASFEKIFGEKAVRVIQRRSPLVRDYDGTPIMIRARTAVMSDYDGTLRVTRRYEAIPVLGAQPRYYLNGQPVLPNYPRSWPRAFWARLS